MNRLKGKTAIVTGGNSGVGEATALLFAKEGANVVICGRRKDALDAVASKVVGIDESKILAVQADISVNDDCIALAKAAKERFGGIDILVNNAGVLDTGIKSIDKYLDEDVQRVIGINQVGTMQCTRAVLPYLRSGASIVNVASVAGVNGGGGAVYASTKAAIIGLTKHTAMLLADKYIRCNAVCPGNIVTPMTSNMSAAQMDVNMIITMRKHGDLSLKPCQAKDVANILLFLASDESAALTGQILVSDFGVNL